MQPGVSVIIATYNGAMRLPKTLHHLAIQQLPQGLQWEVIVVDNNSTDDTYKTVLGEWDKYPSAPPLTLLHEPRPGVTYAREKGVKAASFNYIIICDDDNWLALDYIATVIHILDTNTNIGIVGGWSTGNFEVEPPAWFNKFATAYAVGQRRKESTPINWMATAGAGIRKEAFDKLQQLEFKQILLGPQGKKRSGGEDLELCAAVRAIGYEVYFSTELSFVHFMSAGRLEWSYLKKLVSGSASAQSVFDMYNIIDKMLKKNETPTFGKVYKKLFKQQVNPIRAKNSSIGKAVQFWSSLLSRKVGNLSKYVNKYHVDYVLYLLLNRNELQLRYRQIINFYLRVKTHTLK